MSARDKDRIAGAASIPGLEKLKKADVLRAAPIPGLERIPVIIKLPVQQQSGKKTGEADGKKKRGT